MSRATWLSPKNTCKGRRGRGGSGLQGCAAANHPAQGGARNADMWSACGNPLVAIPHAPDRTISQCHLLWPPAFDSKVASSAGCPPRAGAVRPRMALMAPAAIPGAAALSPAASAAIPGENSSTCTHRLAGARCAAGGGFVAVELTGEAAGRGAGARAVHRRAPASPAGAACRHRALATRGCSLVHSGVASISPLTCTVHECTPGQAGNTCLEWCSPTGPCPHTAVQGEQHTQGLAHGSAHRGVPSGSSRPQTGIPSLRPARNALLPPHPP